MVEAHAEIGPNSHLVDTRVGEGATVAHSVCRRAEIGPDARVGPFAVLSEGDVVPVGAEVRPG